MKKTNFLCLTSLSLLLAGSVAYGLSAKDFTTAKADAVIEYVEFNTETKEFETKTRSASLVSAWPTSNETVGEENEGTKWYYVDSDLTIDHFTYIQGDLRLIVADGVKLTFNETVYYSGPTSLTVYGGPEGTGSIEITGRATWVGILVTRGLTVHKVNLKSTGGAETSSSSKVGIAGSGCDVNFYGSHIETIAGPSTTTVPCGSAMFANNINIDGGADVICRSDNDVVHTEGLESYSTQPVSSTVNLINGNLTLVGYENYPAFRDTSMSFNYRNVLIDGQLDRIMVGDDLSNLTQFNDNGDHYVEDNDDISEILFTQEEKFNENKVVSFQCSKLIPATGIDLGDYENSGITFTSSNEEKIIEGISVLPANASRKKLDWSTEDSGFSVERYQKFSGKLTCGSNPFVNGTLKVKTRDGSNIEKTIGVEYIEQPVVSSITFNPNGGTFVNNPGEATISIDTDENYKISANNAPQVTKEGYTFIGWTNASGELVDFATATFGSDTTLTAKYSKNLATLGISVANRTVKVGETINVSTVYTPNDEETLVSFKYESSDSSVLEFENESIGKAVAKKAGTATIKVTNQYDGKYVTLDITVAEESKGLSGGAIAGIVIGSIFLFLIIAFVVLYILWKKKDFNVPVLSIALTPAFRFINKLFFKTGYNDIELKNLKEEEQ